MKMDLFSIQRVQNLTKDRLATIFNVARHGDPKKRIPKRHFASHFCKKWPHSELKISSKKGQNNKNRRNTP